MITWIAYMLGIPCMETTAKTSDPANATMPWGSFSWPRSCLALLGYPRILPLFMIGAGDIPKQLEPRISGGHDIMPESPSASEAGGNDV